MNHQKSSNLYHHLKTDMRITKIAGNHHVPRTRKQNLMNSNKFQKNISFSSPDSNEYEGNKVSDLYKSFIRDIKNYHRDVFEGFKVDQNLNTKLRLLQ
jgi:hypothetical protein